MQALLFHIKQVYHLSDEALQALSESLKRVQYKKNEILLSEGAICRTMYFLEKGCIRGFYLLDGKEVTHWFAFENDFVSSFSSFITETRSVENIQILEDSVLWGISRDSLYRLYDTFPAIERLGRVACEKYYIRLEERYVNSQFKTATELYKQLLDSNPTFLQRISLGHIASFLGISQETLSRIRSKKLI
jgi:CRP-like cAMP-binding protein